MASASKPSWAAIVARPTAPTPVVAAPTPVVAPPAEEQITTSELIPLPPANSGAVINIRLEALCGWFVGYMDNGYPFAPSQLTYMFPHLLKRLFYHVITTDDWPEPGGMVAYYARPGVTRKTYIFEGNKYLIDFTNLQVGDASYCPACRGPHQFRKGRTGVP